MKRGSIMQDADNKQTKYIEVNFGIIIATKTVLGILFIVLILFAMLSCISDARHSDKSNYTILSSETIEYKIVDKENTYNDNQKYYMLLEKANIRYNAEVNRDIFLRYTLGDTINISKIDRVYKPNNERQSVYMLGDSEIKIDVL